MKNLITYFKRAAMTITLAAVSVMAMAQTTYVITNGTTAFNCAETGQKDEALVDVLNAIKTSASGSACTIQFGRDGTNELNIGTETVTINSDLLPVWGTVTLTGRITGTSSNSVVDTYIATLNSNADIQNTDDGDGIRNMGTGTLQITGGKITSSSSYAVFNRGKTNIIDGTVSSGNTAAYSGIGTVNISGGTVSGTGSSGRAVGTSFTGEATISGGIVTSANSNATQGTIGLSSGSGNRLTITGGTITNTASGGNTIYGNGSVNFNISGAYTFSGTMIGTGGLELTGGGSLILTGVNTYSGQTTVSNGKLQIGDGTSGSIASTSNVKLDNANATLRFEPGADMTFSKVISGSGKVEYKGTYVKPLFFTANNTYGGVTTVESGILYLGNGGTTGMVDGDITVNYGAFVFFNRSDNVSYDGIISGDGGMSQYGSGTLKLSGVHSFTGVSEIMGGTLAFTSSGSIAQSISLTIDGGNLDITAGSKTLKNISGPVESGFIYLGNNTLTIGTPGENDGGGNIGGILTGTGNVIKTGTATLVLNINCTATGTFTHAQGVIDVEEWDMGTAVVWAGNFIQNAGTTLNVEGGINIGGALTLQGGTIAMNLTTSSPSKITAGGAFSASGVTTLNISPAVTPAGQVLIQAASGLGNASAFALNMPGGTASLNATGTQLLLASSGTPPTINPHPQDLTIYAGQHAIFTITASGTPALTYQWQSRAGNGGTWNDLSDGTPNGITYSGVKTATLTLSNVPAGYNGYQYRCVVTNSAGSAESNPATLTVNISPSFSDQPSPVTITEHQNATFTVAADGSPAPTLQWQVSTNGGSTWSNIFNGGIYSDVTTTTLKLNDVPLSCNGYQYRCTASNGVEAAGNATSNAVTLTVTAATTAPTVTSPANSAITSGGGTSFTVTADGNPAPALQWQVSTNGGSTWNAITNDGGGIYSGYTTATLSLTNVPITFNGYQYQCVATNTAGNATSTAATLTVTEAIVYVTNITGVPTEATAGIPLTLTATVVPANATNQAIVWSVSNARTTDATISGTTFTATAAGQATVTATIAGGSSGGSYTQTFEITVSPPTANEALNTANTALRAWTLNGLLHITGLTPGDPLSIYSMTGILVYHTIAPAPETDIRLPAPGIYIVISGERQIKIFK